MPVLLIVALVVVAAGLVTAVAVPAIVSKKPPAEPIPAVGPVEPGPRVDRGTSGQREDEGREVVRPVDPYGDEGPDRRDADQGEDDPYASDPLDEWSRGGRGQAFDAGEDDRAWREDAPVTGGRSDGEPAPVEDGPRTGGIVGALPGF